MTQVNTADGPIATDLPAEAVADLEVKTPEPAAPAAPEEGKQAEPARPEEPKDPEPAREPAKEPEPKPDVKPDARPKKAGPIPDLLSKKHELETQLEAERKVRAELEEKLQAASQQPASPQNADRVKALAEKHGLDPDILADIVAEARAGISPQVELPKEVADMLAEHQAAKAVAAEEAAFNKRADSLAAAIPTEPIKEHKDKLKELAYSDKTDPVTGERYADMELAEIYFRVIKPEVEPGKPSGEIAPTAGTKAAKPLVDFQEIFDRDDPKDVESMDDETFRKYSAWLNEKGGDVPITRDK